MFLTPAQLIEMTGYKRSSLQVGWLRKMGVKHYVRRDGKPVVVISDLTTVAESADRIEPDFSATRRSA